MYGIDRKFKYECIGHKQKRVGSRLRKLKKSTKGIGGKGKMTDKFIDTLQNNFELQFEIMSVICLTWRMQSLLLQRQKPMYGQCSSGSDTWCKYENVKQE
ncbi:uncharacterized protein TNCV_4208281 [Trichonephila clavipes]|nr:uncharacterized protein TNCV_4208281 [Trichonephila clavipes]